jgi:hypothetical protein
VVPPKVAADYRSKHHPAGKLNVKPEVISLTGSAPADPKASVGFYESDSYQGLVEKADVHDAEVGSDWSSTDYNERDDLSHLAHATYAASRLYRRH